MNERRGGGEEAVRDVDRDALLTLGSQAVGDVRELALAPQLVVEQLFGVEQQPADQGRLAVVDGAGGRDAQQLGSRHLEVPLALAVFHRRLRRTVVGARMAALGDRATRPSPR